MRLGIKKVAFALAFCLLSFTAVVAQVLKTPSEGKALVYFVRPSGLGALINFKYFDGEKYLGKFSAGKYLAYECDPGSHLFWAKSENMDFVEAELEAGKVYIIQAEPMMGAIKASVQLIPLNKSDKRYEKRKKHIIKALSKDDAFVYNPEQDSPDEYADLIKKGNEKFAKRKGKNDTFLKVDADVVANPEEFITEK